MDIEGQRRSSKFEDRGVGGRGGGGGGLPINALSSIVRLLGVKGTGKTLLEGAGSGAAFGASLGGLPGALIGGIGGAGVSELLKLVGGSSNGTTINADNNNRFTISLNDATSEFTVTAKNTGTIDNGSVVYFLGATNQGTLTATAGGVDAVTRVDAAGEITDSTGASLSSPILLTAKALSDGTVLENTDLGIQFDIDNTDAQTAGDLGVFYTVATSGSSAVFQIGANAN